MVLEDFTVFPLRYFFANSALFFSARCYVKRITKNSELRTKNYSPNELNLLRTMK
jgi:hypothetical protein